MRHYIIVEIDEDNSLEVEIFGDCEIEDNSFSHEFGTEVRFDTICNDITYDNDKYTKEEQVLIDTYIEEYREDLELEFIEYYEN